MYNISTAATTQKICNLKQMKVSNGGHKRISSQQQCAEKRFLLKRCIYVSDPRENIRNYPENTFFFFFEYSSLHYVVGPCCLSILYMLFLFYRVTFHRNHSIVMRKSESKSRGKKGITTLLFTVELSTIPN